MDLIKAYLMNGKHVDVAVPPKTDPKSLVAEIASSGCWANDHGEEIFHPAHKIDRLRVVKGPKEEKKALKGSK